MYVKKEAYILRNAATKKLKETTLDLANHYKKTRKASFHKMLDGSPNFHRAIDINITKKYSLFAIKHSFYFYNWNIKSELETKFKNGVYRHWRYVKILAGNSKNQFEKNIPSDKQLEIIKHLLIDQTSPNPQWIIEWLLARFDSDEQRILHNLILQL